MKTITSSNKKIKIFLGAYVNSTNAQNLNCLALAQHLDKGLFEVFTLKVYSGNLKIPAMLGVNMFTCFNPHRISKYMGYLWGIYKCDIAYLPKGEIYTWNSFWIKLFKRKSFSTVEGILDEVAIDNAINTLGNYEKVISSYNQFDKLYSITNYLNHYNYKQHSIKTEVKTLYLGTNISAFLNEELHVTSLRNVLIIGNELIRKGVYDFFEISKKFPSISFFVVGSGNGKININQVIEDEGYKNVTYLNSLNSTELSNQLKRMDLHILPSRSEGFPKVTLETAAAGVPSLVYSDYGAKEWITHNQDGFVVDTLEQMIETVMQLKNNPDLLKQNSVNAIALAKRFDWGILIKDWEQEIVKLHHKECQ